MLLETARNYCGLQFHSKVSTQSRHLFQVCTFFQETLTKFSKNWVTLLFVIKKNNKKIKNKNPNLKQISKKWNLQKEKNPGVFNQISAYNFCVWYTSSHNITFKELETSKAMFVGRNHVLFEQLIKLEKAGGVQALHQVWNGDCRLQSFKAPVRCVKWLDSVWATTWILTTHKGPPRPHHQHPASYSHPSLRAVCFTPCLTWWKPHRGKGTTTVHWGELTWTVDRPLIRRRALLRQQLL